MTRINTNTASLVAQNRLQSSNNDLNTALTRLSTGLRINTGADDPAGLIASETLRREITGLTKAISNTQRASQVISTADSALGQVSNLLNDVRGLVVEAANGGALSQEEIAANQLQIDSSLEAINRIAQTTTFQGRKLLDGSQDYISTVGSVGSVKDATIGQAKLGTSGSLTVNVDIQSAATQASATVADTAFVETSSTEATNTFATASSTVSLGGENVTITSNSAFENIEIVEDNALAGTATAGITAGTLTITFDGDSDPSAVSDVLTAVNALDGFVATTDGAGTGTVVTADAAASTATTASTMGLEVTGDTLEELTVAYEVGSGASPTAAFDAASNTLTVSLGTTPGNNTLSNITTAIEGVTVGGENIFTVEAQDNAGAEATGFDDLTILGTDLPAASTSTTTLAGLRADTVIEISGADGSETFTFGVGTSKADIASAINLVSDSTGVTADATGVLTLTSSDYGSNALVAVDVVSEGAGGTFETDLSTARSNGTDIAATINGMAASGSGNSFSLNTSTLSLDMTVDDGSTTDFSFDITGGGATFQLGSDVTSSQRASLGLGSISTGKLGGATGRLYELGSGQARSLTNDINGAADIVDEVITKVVSTRGRLGAFQATTLESNMVSLNDARANLQEAESSIRDADFAQESANLTRAQILVQSGTNVLSLANQNPRNVLSLLR